MEDSRGAIFPNSDLHNGVTSSVAFPNRISFLTYSFLSYIVNSPLYTLQNMSEDDFRKADINSE